MAMSLATSGFAAEPERQLNFANDIVPIFTKASCNSGGCHGKSSGQNGFKLSLLGFEPQEDYEHIVKEARGRRLFPAAPDQSLLLQKSINSTPHGGGKKLDPKSDDYALIVKWINQGMPYGKDTDPKLVSVEVQPKEKVMALKSAQQLKVLAHYSDGYVRDVTRSALYEANEKAMAETGEEGLVTLSDLPGDVAVMIRYQGKVAVFNATAPLGAPVDSLPPARNFIDELVFKKLKQLGMPPSGICDDATFLRRVSIDIAGRLPSTAEMKKFVADTNPKKRDVVIDRLLDSPEYAEYFAGKWGALLRNKRDLPTHARGTYAFHSWIRDSLIENKPYDQFVREVVSATGDISLQPPVAWYRQVKDATAQMEDVAQLFLGQRLQCAQCHHHPFEKWSQQDYYSFSAFFSTVARKPSALPGEEIISHKKGVAQAVNKRTKLTVKPTGLGSETLDIAPEDDPRQALADWLGNKENPFFAKALVNRYWKHFFNRGLIEPEDDMRETNPPSNPALLNALATEFTYSGFDMKQLIRSMAQSTTYQLSAVPNEHNAVDRQNFSRYFPKRLNAEVLFDAVNNVLAAKSDFEGLPAGTRAVALPDNSFNATNYFLTVFGRPESSSACECERTGEASLAQSLHLLNAPHIQAKLSNATGRPSLLSKDPRAEDEKIRDIYESAFTRGPKPEEITRAKAHIDKLTTSKTGAEAVTAKQQAYEDILWALINTKEFLFNH
jgi:hypothetical protein